MGSYLLRDNRKTPNPSDSRCSFFNLRPGGAFTAGRIIRCAWIYNLESKIRENKWRARLASRAFCVKPNLVFIIFRLWRRDFACDFQKVQNNKTSGCAVLSWWSYKVSSGHSQWKEKHPSPTVKVEYRCRNFSYGVRLVAGRASPQSWNA